MADERAEADVLTRLRRVQGQVGGIIRMIEEARDCHEVVRQISAASRALDGAGFKLLATELKACLRAGTVANAANYSEEELEKLFLQLA